MTPVFKPTREEVQKQVLKQMINHIYFQVMVQFIAPSWMLASETPHMGNKNFIIHNN